MARTPVSILLALLALLPTTGRAEDEVHLQGSDEPVRGRIRYEAKGPVVETASGKRRLAWKAVLRIAEHPEDRRPPAPPAPDPKTLRQFEEKRQAIPDGDTGALMALARWARRNDHPRGEVEALRAVLLANAFHTKALEDLRPHTDTYVPQVFLSLPLEGAWRTVVDRTCHHTMKRYAVYAYDFVAAEPIQGKGARLEDHPSWDRPVLAAADGKVAYLENDWRDMKPGWGGGFEESNHIILDHGNDEYTLYHHLKQGSSPLAIGDKVARGQEIARVGSSGASAAPHLHFTLVDREGFSKPCWFDRVRVTAGESSFDADRIHLPEGIVVQAAPAAGADGGD